MRVTVIASAVLILASGCGRAEGAAEWGGTMDTLPSGRVVVTNPARGMWAPGAGWRVVEELRIGREDGSGPEVLGQISVLALDPGGKIWALDRDDQVFKVFGPDGAFIRTVGRRGGGPGEMRQAGGMATTRDGNLIVVDMQGGRISVFDTAGTFLKSFPTSGGFVIIPWPGGIDTAGYLYNPVPRPEGGRFRIALVRYDSAMTPLDTLMPPTARPNVFEFRNPGGGGIMASVPFSPSSPWRLTRHGDFWQVLTGSYRLLRLSGTGDTLRVVTKPFQVVSVTEAEKDTAIARLKWFTSQGGSVDRSRIPDLKPAVQEFQLSEDGYLWVNPVLADTALQRRVFEIFDPEGRFLGEVRLPFDLMPNPRPVIRPDRIIGMTQDENGVPYIVRARIER